MKEKYYLKSVKNIIVIVLCVVLFSTCFVTVSAASKSGTEKNPIVLKRGAGFNSKEYSGTMWYQIKERGETKISFELNAKTIITVYEKRPIGKKKKGYLIVSGKKNYSYSAFGNTTLLISVKTSKKTRVRIKYDLNLDTKTSSEGGYWKADDKSPTVNDYDVCLAKYYIPAKSVPALYFAISEDKRLEHLDYAIQMSRNAAILYLTSNIKIPKKYLTQIAATEFFGMLFDIADPLPSFSFKDIYKNDIKKYSGLNTSTNKAKKGISLTSHVAGIMEVYTIASWDGKTMKGEKGYKGTFKKFK